MQTASMCGGLALAIYPDEGANYIPYATLVPFSCQVCQCGALHNALGIYWHIVEIRMKTKSLRWHVELLGNLETNTQIKDSTKLSSTKCKFYMELKWFCEVNLRTSLLGKLNSLE